MEFILFDAYQVETRRTSGTLTTLDGLINFCMGLTGESAEFLELVLGNFENLTAEMIKELGDLSWYTARMSDVLGFKLSQVSKFQKFSEYEKDIPLHIFDKKDLKHMAITMCITAGKIIDHVKKVAFQGHDLEAETIISYLREVLEVITIIAYVIGSNLKTVIMGNVDKLRKRYPNGFSVEDSRNRVDE